MSIRQKCVAYKIPTLWFACLILIINCWRVSIDTRQFKYVVFRTKQYLEELRSRVETYKLLWVSTVYLYTLVRDLVASIIIPENCRVVSQYSNMCTFIRLLM